MIVVWLCLPEGSLDKSTTRKAMPEMPIVGYSTAGTHHCHLRNFRLWQKRFVKLTILSLIFYYSESNYTNWPCFHTSHRIEHQKRWHAHKRHTSCSYCHWLDEGWWAWGGAEVGVAREEGIVVDLDQGGSHKWHSWAGPEGYQCHNWDRLCGPGEENPTVTNVLYSMSYNVQLCIIIIDLVKL